MNAKNMLNGNFSADRWATTTPVEITRITHSGVHLFARIDGKEQCFSRKNKNQERPVAVFVNKKLNAAISVAASLVRPTRRVRRS